MPELPEVETVMRGLIPALEGRIIAEALVRRSGLRTPFPKNFAGRLTGRRVLKLTRRAKYILAALDNGESLAIHLGMSGRIGIHSKAPPLGPHDHVLLKTARSAIVYTDPRRFGLMTLIPTDRLTDQPLFADLGPEPLGDGFTPAALEAALKGRKAPIKAALLDQRLVAGLGNIYVCEALFAAKIAPTRPAESVSEIKELHRAIHAVLKAAIRSGGSSLRDYRKVDGAPGYFQHRFKVYDREGAACPRRGCSGIVARIRQSGRSSFHCPQCQK